MIRSKFLMSLPGFALLTRWRPSLLEAPKVVEPKVWHSEGSGPLHFLLTERRNQVLARGGKAKFFHCNEATHRRLWKELMGGMYRELGAYQTTRIEGITWVSSPDMEDDQIWVHSFACLRCHDTGRIGNMKLMGNRVDGLIPDPVPYTETSCPRCQRIEGGLSDEDRKWWLREYQKKFGGRGFEP